MVVLTFGQVEFALITGLCFGHYNESSEDSSSAFLQLFPKKISFSILESQVACYSKADKTSIITRKLVVLYLLHSLVFVKSGSCTVDSKLIKLCDDPAAFNSFPWGRLVYEELVKEWTTIIIKCCAEDAKNLINWTPNTFPFAIQAWAMESIEHEFAKLLGTKDKDPNIFPRMLRWKAVDLGNYNNNLMAKQTIFDVDFVSLIFLTN